MRRSSDDRSSPSMNSIERKCEPSISADVENTTDVWVRDLTRRADFAVEPLERRFVSREILREKLQRDRLIQFEVFSFVNFAHSAPAQQTENAITLVENCSRRETALAARARKTRIRSGWSFTAFSWRRLAHGRLFAIERRETHRAGRSIFSNRGRADGALGH